MDEETKKIEEQTKQVAAALAPVIEKTIEAKLEESTEESKKTLEALQKDIAEVKKMSKKNADPQGLEKVWTFFKTYFECKRTGDFSAMKAVNEWTDSEWGYLVPREFWKELIRVAELTGLTRKLAAKFPMTSKEMDISTLATGATAYVVWEALAITESTLAFGQKILISRKFAVLIKNTPEVADDNWTNEPLATLIAKLAWEAIAELEDAQMMTGAGTGLNQSWIMVDAWVTVVTMAATKTSFEDVTYWDLVDLKHAVKMKYKSKSAWKVAWVMSEDIFAIVEKIVDTTGQPIIKERANLPDNFTLMGYPVEISEVMPAISDDAVSTKFMAFGAFKYFAFGDRQKISLEQGYSSWDFEKDIKSVKVKERVAGIILIGAAFATLKTAAA